MKKLLIIGGIIVVVVVVFLVVGISNIGPIIKKAVNTYGPDITKTAVRLGDVDVSIFSGQASLQDFSLGNPKGFSAAQAIRVGSILVDVDEKSLMGDTMVIDRIAVVGPEITFEKVRGTDNFQTILKNVKEATGQSGSSKKEPVKKEEKGTGKSLLIKDFVLKDGKVTLSESILAGKSISVPLPDIHLKDVGKKEGGASAAEAFEEILAALYGDITSSAVTDALNQELKKLGADLGATGEEVKKQLETTVGEGAKKELEGATDQLKGLLGK